MIKIIENTFSRENEKLFIERHLPLQFGFLVSGGMGQGKSRFVDYLMHFTQNFDNPRLKSFVKYNAANVLSSAQEGKSIPNQGVVVFDDIEDLIRDRQESGGGNIVLPWLLNELDGGDKDVFRIIVFVTNYTDEVENALLRPGRLDMHIKFKPPKVEFLKKLLLFHTQNDIDDSMADNIITTLKNIFREGKNISVTFAHISFLCRLVYTSTEKDLKNLDFWKKTIEGMKDFSPFRKNKINDSDEPHSFGFSQNTRRE